MLLKSIQIQGFKSFADKTTLKFGKGITAVVGPNGSGKSNISDAVRWVLGEQSTKSLRGQSMEDVIFSGTALRRPHGYCEVTLNIDNTDRTLNFDNDAVSVTRRYYRSHESEYLINGVSVRLRDVNELFMDTGLGRDGYSMIGQGKIDSIISTKSEERRDIFEEASGISKYRYRKAEAQRKLDAAEDNLTRLSDIMQELSSRVGPLKQQSEKAEAFLQLSEQKKNTEIGLWLNTLDHSKDRLREQESRIAAAELSYRQLDEELKNSDSAAEENSRDFARYSAQMDAEKEKISSLNEEIIQENGHITVLENDAAHKSDSVQRLKEEIEQLQKSGEDAEQEIAFKTAVAADKEKAVQQSNQILSDFSGQLETLALNSDAASREIEELVYRQNEVAGQIAELRVQKTSAESSLAEAKSRQGVITEAISQRQKEQTDNREEVEKTRQLIEEISRSVEQTMNALAGYRIKETSRKDKAELLKTQNETLRLDLEAKKRRVQILTELERNMEGFGHSVKAVMNEAKTGLLRGVCGTVADIVRVDKKYSVAVETALGATIQQIVCENEADAKRAISFLKRSGKGRATFLPVDSIRAKEFKEQGFEKEAGYIGLAPDLISCEEKYREIVRYLLGNTLVCEDLDSAAAISKKFGYRLKTVSLDGQVVNAGGSMTGGSLIKNAGILSRSSDIARLKGEAQELEEKLRQNGEVLRKAQEDLAGVQAQIAALDAQSRTESEDKIRAVGELKRLTGIQDSLCQSVEDLQKENGQIDQKVEQLTAFSAQTEEQLTLLNGKIAELQKEIDQKTGGRQAISDQREAITEKITGIKLQILETRKDIETLHNAVESMRQDASHRVEKISNLEQQIGLLRDACAEIGKNITGIRSQIEEKKQAITECEAQVTALGNKRDETEKQGRELRNSEREKLDQREKLSGELARLVERREVMLQEYDGIIGRLFDEYQLTRSQAQEMEIPEVDPVKAKKDLASIKAKIRELGNVNVAAIEEYREVYERYSFMKEQMDDVQSSKEQLLRLIHQLTSQMQSLFLAGFEKINRNFSETFREIFGGGKAYLELSDPENVLESGIEIRVNLPGKNVPSLDGLSGGEKALIALAIYFSIMKVNAPPFCFLDEVDTALDDINVERVAEYMKRPDFSTQFICVTHRRGTMEAADMLYGVTMQEKGVTKLLELDVSELEKKLQLESGE